MKCAVCILLIAGMAQGQRPVPAQGQPSTPGSNRRQNPGAQAAQAPVDPADRGTVEGRITSVSTGEALRKVTLTLRTAGRGGSYSASTDADGRFQFTAVDPGRYTLMADKAGLVRQMYGARGFNREGTTIEVGTKQNVTGINFQMTPQGVVTGRVADEDGDAIQGAPVQVWRYSYPRGKRQLVPYQGGSTNDQGEFRIASLPPGRYYLSASRNRSGMGDWRGPRGQGQPPAEGYVTTYFPQSIDANGAAPIDVRPGSEMRGLDIRLAKARLFRIRGRVTGLPAAPEEAGGRGRGLGGPGAILSLVPRSQSGESSGGGRNSTMASRTDGAFEFAGVLPGSYYILAQMMGPGQRMNARYPVDVSNGDVEGLTLPLNSGLDLAGTVRLEGAETKLTAMRLAFMPIDGMGMPGGFSQVKEDGTFQVKVAADKYTLDVSGVPEGCYVKAIRLAGREVLETGLDLTSGGGGPVDIVLSADAGELAGRVENARGDPVSGVMVTVVPSSGAVRRDRLKSATTDATGSFHLRGLAPGEYKVFAWEEVEPNAWMDADFRRPFESSAATAKVTEKMTENVALKLIGRDVIEQEVAKMR